MLLVGSFGRRGFVVSISATPRARANKLCKQLFRKSRRNVVSIKIIERVVIYYYRIKERIFFCTYIYMHFSYIK